MNERKNLRASDFHPVLSNQEDITALKLVLEGMAVALENLNKRIVTIEWCLGIAEDEGKGE